MKLNKKSHFSAIGRWFDLALSKNMTLLVTLFLVSCFFVTGFVLLGIFVEKSPDVMDLMLSFINPGNSYAGKVCPGHKPWLIITGLLGMMMLSGLLIPIVGNILARRVEKIQNGHTFYHFDNHVVIMGYNTMTAGLTMQAAKKYPASEIVLQTVKEAPNVRHELFSKLTADIEKNIMIVSGNRNIAECLEKLHLDRAQALFVLGETDEHDHDSLNIKCLELIRDMLAQAKTEKRKPCHVLFEYQSTYTVFQQQDIPNIKKYLDFMPFNFYECWAQKVLVDGGNNTFPFLDREPMTAESDKHVHLVVVGMSQMGVAMGIQAAHICHFPNFVTKGIKTRITFIDENADREMNFLQGRYRHLFNEADWSFWDISTNEKQNNHHTKEKFTDIEFEFIKGSIENPVIQQRMAEWAKTQDKLLTVAVCFGSSPAAIAAGLYLPDEIYDNEIPVFVRQGTSDCTLNLLSGGKYKNVKPFGMLDEACDLKKADSLLPMIVNYIYSYYYDNRENPESLPDKNVLEEKWRELKTAKQWSNRYNANMFEMKLRAFDIKNLDIDKLAKIEHNRWNIEELLLGFRPTTTEEKKIIGNSLAKKEEYKAKFVHNDICPYDEIVVTDGINQNGKEEKIKNTKEFDICFSESIPMIVEYLQKQKNENIQSATH